MTISDEAVQTPRPAPRLGRAGIVDAALALIEADGLPALSMRRLGAALGVEAAALYRYVPSRDDLLDGVVERVVDELSADPEVHLLPGDDWRDYLTRLAHGVRHVALAHPRSFPLVATRPPAAPWIRPPLRSLRWIEAFLEGLLARGFTDATAVAAYRAYSSFLIGHLLLELSAQGVQTGPEDPVTSGEGGSESLEHFPQIARLEPVLREDQAAEEFAMSLAHLLDRLDALRSS